MPKRETSRLIVLIFLVIFFLKPEIVAFCAARLPLIPKESATYRPTIPDFVLNVPTGNFVGISPPSPSISEARSLAIQDVKQQILNSMGAFCSYDYRDEVYMNKEIDRVERNICYRFSGEAEGVIQRVEEKIIKNYWIEEPKGHYIFFVLVRYPAHLIGKMRAFSKGARIHATLILSTPEKFLVRIAEFNGLAVFIERAEINITYTNEWAKPISLFCCKVKPEWTEKSIIPLNQVRVCGESIIIKLPVGSHSKRRISSLFPWYRKSVHLYLIGHDELGKSHKIRVSR